MILEITDTTHTALGQHCSGKPMPPLPCFWLNTGPRASVGGTPGTTARSISCAKSKPIWLTHYGVAWAPVWGAITEVAGPISIDIVTHLAPVGGSKIRDVWLCHLDSLGACYGSPCTVLGKSAPTNIAPAAGTTYPIPIYNSAGTVGTYAALPGAVSGDVLMWLFTFSGPATVGYHISHKWRGQIAMPYTTGIQVLRRRREGH